MLNILMNFEFFHIESKYIWCLMCWSFSMHNLFKSLLGSIGFLFLHLIFIWFLKRIFYFFLPLHFVLILYYVFILYIYFCGLISHLLLLMQNCQILFWRIFYSYFKFFFQWKMQHKSIIGFPFIFSFFRIMISDFQVFFSLLTLWFSFKSQCMAYVL